MLRLSGNELHTRLLAHALESGCRATLGLERQRQGHLGECRQRWNVARLQLAPLNPRDACHQRQMVVGPPLLAADARPWADVAVVHPLRVIRRRKRLVVLADSLRQSPTNQPKVGGVVGHAILVNGRGDVWRDHIETLGLPALDPRQHLAIEPKLKNGSTSRLTGELCIGDLICPRAERARGINLQQNVWSAVPLPILESARTIASAPARMASTVRATASVLSLMPARSTR